MKVRRILAGFLCLTLLAGLLSMGTSAAQVLIAEWSIEGGTTHQVYASGSSDSAALEAFEDGWNDAMDAADANHQKMMTFKLYRDWIGDGSLATYTFSSGSGFNWWAIYIQDGAKVTLDLNGHIINRNRTSSPTHGNGEVIYVDEGATLVINDSNPNAAHTGTVNSEGLWRPDSSGNVTIYGGIITGGYSRNGAGGIHMKAETTVVLIAGSIVGNKCDEDIGGGGGIELDSDGGLLQMFEGASILYNVSGDNDGGGVEVFNGSFEMYGGRISYNRANDCGGGVNTYEDDGTAFVMNGGVISYNQGNYGGGVYIDSSVLIEDGKILNNTASTDGGGMYFNDDDSPVIEQAEIRDNTAAGNGGGIYTNTDDVEVSNAIITGNSAQNGGGIYACNDGLTLTDCTISENSASKYGGGIFFYGEDSTIGNTVLTDNTDGGGGSGIYIDDFLISSGEYVFTDLTVTGPSGIGIYQGNDSTVTYTGTCVVGSKTDAFLDLHEGAYMSTEGLTSDSAIWLRSGDFTRVLSKDRGGHNSKGVYCVNEEYTVVWENDPYDSNYRHLLYLDSSEAETPVETETVSSGILETTEYKTENHSYSLLKGTYSCSTSYNYTEDLDIIYYYSDGYFEDAPEEYNTHLSTMSMNLAMSGFYANAGSDGTSYLKEGEHIDYPAEGDYKNKHAYVRQLLSDIGVADENIYVNDWYITKPTSETIGVAIGQKALTYQNGTATGETLIPVVIRSANYELEWVSNVTIGSGSINNGEAYGFSTAAEKAYACVQDYITDYGLTDEIAAGTVKFWVVGYSRGGATANLLSKRLTDEYCNPDKYGTETHSNQVYGYCYEAPQGGTDLGIVDADYTYNGVYENIHNCINVCDIVPKVAPSDMGFHRYGVDHYIPGSPETDDITKSVASTDKDCTYTREDGETVTCVTTYSDNTPYYVKAVETYVTDTSDTELLKYYTQRNLAVEQLEVIAPDVVLDDYFYTANLNYLSALIYGFIEPAGDVTKIPRMDQWEDMLVEDLVSSSLKSRTYYATQAITLHDDTDNAIGGKTFQEALQTVMGLVYGLSSERMTELTNCFSNPADHISVGTIAEIISLWDDVLGDWDNITEAERAEHIEELWELLMEFDVGTVLTEKELAELESVWPSLADVLFRFISYDYDNQLITGVDETQAHVGTLIYNLSRIGANHYPEINLAWLRTYDSFYTTDIPGDDAGVTTRIARQSAETCEAPAAYIGTTALQSGDTVNTFLNSQTLLLQTEADGDAIYYTISVNDAADDTIHIYRDGIALDCLDETENGVTSYTVTTYAMQYGVMSAERTYRLDLVTAIPTAEIVSRSLTLGGELGLNFYTQLEYPELMTDAYMEFTVSGKGGQSLRLALSDGVKDTNGYYVFTCPLNVLQMNQDVTATFCFNGKEADRKTDTVSAYLQDIVAHHSEEAELVSLAKAVANYGYYAQIALQQAHGFTLGTDGSSDYCRMPAAETQPDTGADLSAYRSVLAGSMPEISKLSRALALDHKTDLHLTFSCEEGYTPRVTVTTGDNTSADYTLTEQEDGSYLLTIPEIAAQDLGTAYTVHFFKEGTEQMTVQVSALSYADSVLRSETATEELKNAVATLYDYYIATLNYINR